MTRAGAGRDPRIVIIGAGPTGLGAGYRLDELGYDDWVLLEAGDRVGGLATSSSTRRASRGTSVAT